MYGVAVPGTEGAAGMAAITVDGTPDLESLRSHLGSLFPAYARPLFVRIQNSIATTATFKHQKADLVREGFDPATTSDAIYLNAPSQKAYVRLDGDLFRRIHDGTIRL